MKLFKRDRESGETFQSSPSSNSSTAQQSNGPFGHPLNSSTPSFMQSSSKSQNQSALKASFPQNYEKIKKKSKNSQSVNLLLTLLVQELAQLGDAEDFQFMMKKWGAALASQMISQSAFIESEERFNLWCTYLNELMLFEHLGSFECTLDEQNHLLSIEYAFTPFDFSLANSYAEHFWVSFYGEFFRVLMSETVATHLELQKVEAGTESWNFSFKG